MVKGLKLKRYHALNNFKIHALFKMFDHTVVVDFSCFESFLIVESHEAGRRAVIREHFFRLKTPSHLKDFECSKTFERVVYVLTK